MSDSATTEPERCTQLQFRIGEFAAGVLLLIAIFSFDRWLVSVPNRHELGPRLAVLRFTPVDLRRGRAGPFGLAGAWIVTSDDPRFGGVSALAMNRGRLLALSDSGVLVQFAPPRGRTGRALIRELPDGPGSSAFKRNRDSEALALDPSSHGWWVAFENSNELWLYDASFGRTLKNVKLGPARWPANRGVEGMVATGDHLLLFPEKGQNVVRVSGRLMRQFPITNAGGRLSDVVALAPDRWIAIERRLTPFGFRNLLVILTKTGAGYSFGHRTMLPLGPIDNAEAIAVELLPNGSRRLWVMTDDNFQPPLRTLLIALDMPAE